MQTPTQSLRSKLLCYIHMGHHMLAVAGMFILLVAASSEAVSDTGFSGDQLQEVRLAGGVKGMVYQTVSELCGEMSRGSNVNILAVPTQGSWDNAALLAEGNVQFALAQLDVIAKYSENYLDQDLVAIRPLYTEYLHILVREPFELLDISELAGKRIFMGRSRSGTAVTAKLLLDLNGIPSGEYRRVDASGFDDICRLLREDSLDIVMHVGSLGNRFVRDLLESVNCRLFSLDHSTIRRLTLDEAGGRIGMVGIGTIPQATFPGQIRSIITVATPVVLFCQLGIHDSVVRSIDSLLIMAIDSVRAAGEQGPLWLESDVPQLPPKVVPFDHEIWDSGGGQLEFWTNIVSLSVIILFGFLVLQRYSRRFVRLMRRQRSALFLVVLASVCLVCTVGIYSLEHDVNQHFESIYETLWSMLIYLTSGLENRVPITVGGRVFAAVMLAASPVILAILVGFFASSILMNALERKMTGNLKNHYVILNWSNRALRVVEQIHSPDLIASEQSVVVIMSDDPQLNLEELQKRFRSDNSDNSFEDVYFHPGDPCHSRSLLNVNVQDAKSIVIMADTNEGDTVDEKSIRSLLALQKIAEECQVDMHVVVELMNIENSSVVENIARHFPGVIDSVSGGRVRTLLLAQATLIPGLTDFYRDLLSFGKDTNELYLVPVPDASIGKLFTDYAADVIRCRSKQPMIPIGVRRLVDGKSQLVANPRANNGGGDENPLHRLEEGDMLLVMSYDAPDPKEMPGWE